MAQEKSNENNVILLLQEEEQEEECYVRKEVSSQFTLNKYND